MNISPSPRRSGGVFVGLVVVLALVGITGWIGYKFWYDKGETVAESALITRAVSRGPFDHIVLQQGEIESSSNIEIVCEVQSRGSSGTQILWVIDEGTRVRAGDKLVELDSSQLEQELKEDRLRVLTAESNVKAAEAVLQQAEIARQEYIEGVYETEKMQIESEIDIADQDRNKAMLALNSTTRLVAKGLMKELQLEADKFAVRNQSRKHAAWQQKLDVLQNLTVKKMLVQYDSDIESANASLSATTSELAERRSEMADREQQIRNCVMSAPSDGVVVHANRYSSRGGSAEFVVEAGALVRERQAIIRLPDPTRMQVRCKINESQVTLIREGMPVKIAIDAIPGLRLRGRVSKVNRYAEPGGWMSSSIKEYATLIEILDPPEDIRTGMTAAVEIFVEQLPDSLQIPIQGLYEHGGEMYTLIRQAPQQGTRGSSKFETRVVKIGATNDTMASVKEGLQEGESVILNLRQHLTLMDLPVVEREDNSDLDDIRLTSERASLDAASASFNGFDDRGPAGDGSRRRGEGGGPRGEGAGPRGEGAGPRGEGAGSRGEGAGSRGEGAGPNGDQRRGPREDLGAEQSEQSDVATNPQGSRERNDRDGDGTITRTELRSTQEGRFSERGGQ